MSTNWTKFNMFVDALCRKQIDMSADVFKVMLTNTAPTVTNQHYSDISGTELGNGNGYTTGGMVVPGTSLSNTNGVETLADSQMVFTASGSGMGPFRYAIFYDSTAQNQPLMGFYDYGSSVSLNGPAGEQFTIQTGGALLTVQ